MTPPANQPHSDSGGANQAERELLNKIIADYLERVETGAETRGIDEICSEHPELAPKIRRRVEALKNLGLWSDAPVPEQNMPERLGDFKIIRLLGGGGMGVVYEAEQISLGRRVALKLIRPEHLFFDTSRERFRREVDAISRLQHPGIVPIYTVGDEQGVPYFAMELVEGRTLGEILVFFAGRNVHKLSGADFAAAVAGEGNPPANHALFAGSWVNVCVRVVEQAARALEHAHERGVLHRDLKPSNIIITNSGRVLLLDFGLAISEGVSRMTRSGVQLGSIPYAAPELLGANPNPSVRSDIYNLGVTLYEILTLQLPFEDSTADVTVRRILEGAPVSPRLLNRTVSRDIETVCLKAMQRDAARRYSSAGAFAADLRNLDTGSPIQARAPGTVDKLYHWALRHRGAAAAILLLIFIITGVPAGIAYYENLRADEATRLSGLLKDERDAARRAEQRAESERERALADFQLANDSIEQMLTKVAEGPLAQDPRLDELRAFTLEKAGELYEKFLDRNAGKPALARDSAAALARVGRVRLIRGDGERAMEAFARESDILESLLKENPTDYDIITSLIDNHVERANYLANAEHRPEARALIQKAIEIAGRVETDKAPPLLQVTIAGAHRALAEYLKFENKLSETLTEIQYSLDITSRVLATDPRNYRARRARASALHIVGSTRRAQLNLDAAATAGAEAVSIAGELLKEKESYDNSTLFTLIARSHAAVLALAKRLKEAAELHSEEILVTQKLADSFPRHRPLQLELAGSFTNLGATSAQLGKLEDADAAFTGAMKIYEKYSNEPGAVPETRNMYAACLNNIGRLHYQRKNYTVATDFVSRALKIEKELLTENPEHPIYRNFYRNQNLTLSNISAETGDWNEAIRGLYEYGAGASRDRKIFEFTIESLSRMMTKIATRENLAAAERDALFAEATRRALEICKEAEVAGIVKSEWLAGTANLAALRERPEFQTYMNSLAAKSK